MAKLLVAVAILMPALAGASERDDRIAGLIDAVPEFARLPAGTVNYVLRGQLGAKRSKRAERLAALVVADLRRRVALHPATGRPATIDVCLFASSDLYAGFDRAVYGPAGGPSPLGYYDPNLDLVVANVSGGMGNLRHELVHPLLGEDFASLPSWLNEGFGSLYGTARVTRRQDLHFLVNYRLRDLHRALARDELPSLEALVLSSRSEVYGDQAMVYYALARYLLLYMDRQGTLGDFYRAVRAADGEPATVLAALRARIDEQAFRRWSRGLSFPPKRS